jgi:pseudouridine-5'-phosphate glycosidase
MENVVIHEKVIDAQARGVPVVALESTIITHGMPYPKNIEVAKKIECAVVEEGATPATAAIIDGVLRVGLDEREFERLGQGEGLKKISRRDLAAAVAGRWTGGTTVAGTMILASMAGIPFFATGGIGGVHRGAETTFDVSADLRELGETSVCVVSAGAKAILDLPKTLEVLETWGVPVVGYKTRRFPSFYSPASACPVSLTADSPQDIARICHAHWKLLGMKGGVLIANPIPHEFGLPEEEVEVAIGAAVEQAAQQGISGAALTPFLLATLERLTKGKSLEANIALVLNNARLAARIARAFAEVSKEGPGAP